MDEAAAEAVSPAGARVGIAALTSFENLPVYLTAADVDGDGNLDLIVAHCCGQSDTTYFLGNGDGTFQAEQQLPLGSSPMAVAVDTSAGLATVVSADNVGAVAAVTVPLASLAGAADGSARSASGVRKR